jgi:hypothetical protein
MQVQRLISAAGFAITMRVETAACIGVTLHLAAFSGLIGLQMRIELQSGGFTQR